MVGARARQGPHQTAQKSTSTGLSLWTTSLSQLAAVSSTTLALAIARPPFCCTRVNRCDLFAHPPRPPRGGLIPPRCLIIGSAVQPRQREGPPPSRRVGRAPRGPPRPCTGRWASSLGPPYYSGYSGRRTCW